MLHAFYGAHVLRALEGAGIGAAQLAHAALHLRDRFVLVLFHPVAQFALDVTQVIDTVAHQRRAQHGDVGSDHEQLDDIFRVVDAAGGGQAGLDAAKENSDPGQRQAQRLRRAQQNVGSDFQFFQIDVRLIEAIEEHQPVGARLVEALRHIRRGC